VLTPPTSPEQSHAVAIVGIGCRFPGGVADPAGFWQLLLEGRDAVGEIPTERIDIAHFFDPRPATPGRMSSRWGGYLQGIEDFDAAFFGIAPREAERMDPAQRLVLETAWESLEDAQIDPAHLEGSTTGVFIGQWLNDFEGRLFADPEEVDFYMTTGSGRYATSGRLSYLLGLRGPSFTVDTACSSSLVAVHQAVRSLRNGECSLALAGGVNVIMQPHIHVAYSQSRMMAADGRCKFGDARGDGYVRSEGAAVIALKPLQAALADGDRIYAIIRGSAVNNDGRSSGSMGTPSREGQEALLRTAYADAGVDPARVGYVEAHGTGTRAGDPVELGALGTVLAPGRAPGARARVGSVKTNLGHTEGAAGMAGLIKLALCVHHGHVPASLHCRELNPAVDWAQAPFELARQAAPWDAAERIGGVSAFGIAGTNAHIVLANAPTGAPAAAPAAIPMAITPAPWVLPLSAQSPEALRALAARHAEKIGALAAAKPRRLRDHLWATATRRSALRERAAIVATDPTTLLERLRAFAEGEAPQAEGRWTGGAPPRLAFVVPGQGAQWSGMARELLVCAPVFRIALEECDRAARAWMPCSLLEQLQIDEGRPGYRLDQIDVIQPTLVALAIAYARLWQSLGVQPAAVVGHSMGEVAAACIAGALSVEQAMRIVCRRSALMRTTSGRGAMALVELSMEEAQARLAGHEHALAVAVSNSPRSSVISGDPAAVQQVMAGLERDQIFCRLVKVDVASHSPQMQPLAEALHAELADLTPAAPTLPMVSTVLGRQVQGTELGAAYWAANLRQCVRFTDAVRLLLGEGVSGFIELGPHPVLLPAVQQTAQSVRASAHTLACGRREQPDAESFASAFAALWAHGHGMDWARIQPRGEGRADLPPYPWQRERCWLEAADRTTTAAARHGGLPPKTGPRHALLEAVTELGGEPASYVWEVQVRPDRIAHLGQHQLHGSAVLAASTYVELACAAARALATFEAAGATPAPARLVKDLRFEQPLYLHAEGGTTLQLRAEPDAGDFQLRWYSAAPQGWLRHASARLVDASPATALPAAGLPQAGERMDGAALYQRLQAKGASFGAALQGIGQAWLGDEHAAAMLHTPPAYAEPARPFCCEPWALDACFQLAAALIPGDALWMPTGVSQIELATGRGARPDRVVLQRRSENSEGQLELDLSLVAEGDDSTALATLRGLRLVRLSARTPTQPQRWILVPQWIAEGPPEPVAPASAAPRPCVLLADRGNFATAYAEATRGTATAPHLVPADADRETLQAALRAAAKKASGTGIDIVIAGGLDLADTEPVSAAALMPFVQALQSIDGFEEAPRCCWVVTRGAHAVGGADGPSLSPAQAALTSLLGTCAAELPALWGGGLDLDPRQPAAAQAAWVRQTICAGRRGDAALRDGQRHVLQLAPPPADGASGAGAARFRTDATVLLTGGLGGVGAAVARGLVQMGARRLLLLGRMPLPPRREWQHVAAGTAAARAVTLIQALEAQGANVHHAAVDVADRQALARCLAEFSAERWPPVRSVVHAAGVTDDRLLSDLNAQSLAQVLHGKVQGAWNLHQLLPELDHFVLFSSVAALLPQPGQASYAAANAALDALALRRQAQGQPALSINWGVWQGLGFAATEGGSQAQQRLAKLGLPAFDPAQGLLALQHLLGGRLTRAAVLPVDAAGLGAALREQALPASAAAMLKGLAQEAASAARGTEAAGDTLLQQLQTAAPEARAALLEDRLVQLASTILRLPAQRLDRRTPLGSYGLNSLMALELRNCIERDLQLPLSATALWNYPTLTALGEHLLGRITATAAAAPQAAEGAPAATAPVPPAAAGMPDIESMSEDEALQALRQLRRGARSAAP
jgi:myxalamid-type polyketide synthase MxaE and MxaD